jgi:hypothetical protein
MGTSYNPHIVSDGLVLCLDAANPRSYSGAGSTWSDLSGNGNNGTFGPGTAAPTFSSGNGGSIVFGGNDYVNCGNNSILNNTSNYYSISAWFKTTYTGNWQWICQFGEHAGNKDRSLVVRSNGFATNYTYGNDVIGTTNVRIGDWFFAVATTTPTSKKIYVNGILENQGSWTSASYNFTNCTIGVLNNFVSYPFNGNIAQVSIYNRALTAQEIRQNFNATRGRYGI